MRIDRDRRRSSNVGISGEARRPLIEGYVIFWIVLNNISDLIYSLFLLLVRRIRTVHLSKATPKGAEGKKKVVEALQDGIDEYDTVIVFSFENMRTNHFKELRKDFSDSRYVKSLHSLYRGSSSLIPFLNSQFSVYRRLSFAPRFFLGKNKVMQIAIGKTEETSYRPNTYKMSEFLKGQCGILLTNKTTAEVQNIFDAFRKESFARAGAIATDTIKLEPGVLHGQESSKVEYFRSLGMPVKVQNAQLYLMEPFVVCQKERKMSPEQCAILKQMGIKMSLMKVLIVRAWKDGEVVDIMDGDGA